MNFQEEFNKQKPENKCFWLVINGNEPGFELDPETVAAADNESVWFEYVWNTKCPNAIRIRTKIEDERNQEQDKYNKEDIERNGKPSPDAFYIPTANPFESHDNE